MLGGGYSLQSSQSQALDMQTALKQAFNYNAAMNVGKGKQTSNASSGLSDSTGTGAGLNPWLIGGGIAAALVALLILRK